MKIYRAGDGCKAETIDSLNSQTNKGWGVLLSYKSVKTKDGKGSLRFRELIKNKTNANQ